MSPAAWSSTKASRVFAALQRIGWTVKRKAKGSHPRICSGEERGTKAPLANRRILR